MVDRLIRDAVVRLASKPTMTPSDRARLEIARCVATYARRKPDAGGGLFIQRKRPMKRR
jgi:hypothetical protein